MKSFNLHFRLLFFRNIRLEWLENINFYLCYMLNYKENFQINIEEHINLPDENGNFKCFVTCKDEETIINVFNDLINNDRGEGSLRNSIICDEYLYDDNFSSIFILSQES